MASSQIVSFFDDPFADWEAHASFPQRWDSGAIGEHIARLSGDSVGLLDVGCGGGRLAAALSGSYEEYLGIDHSLAAARIFESNRIAGLLGPPNTIGFVFDDVVTFLLGADIPTMNVAVLGSVTINSFNTSEAVCSLLDALRQSLGPRGAVIVSVYEDGIGDRLSPFQFVVDALDGELVSATGRVLWRGMHYQESSRLLLHNVFIEDCRAPIGMLGVHTERVWTESELVELAGRCGFGVHHRSGIAVDGGGADGWPVSVLTLAQG